MKNTLSVTLSTTYTAAHSTTRLTLSMVHTLLFIHRFRHVTTQHVMYNLSHAKPNTSNQLLTRLRAKGLIGRHYTGADRAANLKDSDEKRVDKLEAQLAKTQLHIASLLPVFQT